MSYKLDPRFHFALPAFFISIEERDLSLRTVSRCPSRRSHFVVSKAENQRNPEREAALAAHRVRIQAALSKGVK